CPETKKAANITAPNNQHTIPGISHHGQYDHWTVLVPAGKVTHIKLSLRSIAAATPLTLAHHPGHWLSIKIYLVGSLVAPCTFLPVFPPLTGPMVLEGGRSVLPPRGNAGRTVGHS